MTRNALKGVIYQPRYRTKIPKTREKTQHFKAKNPENLRKVPIIRQNAFSKLSGPNLRIIINLSRTQANIGSSAVQIRFYNVASFRNEGDRKATKVENRDQFRTYGGCEIVEIS